MMKLNIGAGKTQIDGFTPWDISEGNSAYPLPMASESVDEVYASHVLEHIGHQHTMDALREWVRVLRPGGRMRVAVPDFDRVARAYVAGEKIGDHPAEAYIMGGQVDENDYHRSMWSVGKLAEQMAAAGLVCVEEWASEYSDCSSLHVSANVQGIKPVLAPPLKSATDPADLKVVGVWSCPRLGFMDNMQCMLDVLPRTGMRLIRGIGVFWGQALERICESAMGVDPFDGREPDALLAFDYDSVFVYEDVVELVRLFAENPDATAICAHQYARASNRPLWNVRSRPWGTAQALTAPELSADELYPVDTAHFGLTLIRTAFLKSLPHPWFISTPDADGKWGDGKTDDDIHFWDHMKANGGNVYVAPRVVIGHLEMVVRWPGRDLGVVHQHIYDWNGSGRPVGTFADNNVNTKGQQ